jgi:hypothetical protein
MSEVVVWILFIFSNPNAPEVGIRFPGYFKDEVTCHEMAELLPQYPHQCIGFVVDDLPGRARA